MSGHAGAASDDTPPPNTPTTTPNPKKRPLEASAAEFVEKGWKLVQELHTKKEYPQAFVKDLPIGEPKGTQFFSYPKAKV